MATPGVGFSIGDIVAGVDLAIKAADALKDANGAVSQYHQAVVELKNVRSVITQLQTLSSSGTNSSNLDIIHLCAYACNIPLSNFRQKVVKFEKHFGQSGASKLKAQEWIVSSSRKVQWALVVEKQLAKLKESIHLPMLMITTLLQLEDAARASHLRGDLETCLQTTEGASQKTELLDAYVRQQLTTRDEADALSRGIGHMTMRQEQFLSMQNRQHLEMLEMLKRVYDAVIDVNSRAVHQEHELVRAIANLNISLREDLQQTHLKTSALGHDPHDSAVLSVRQSHGAISNDRREHQVVVLFLILVRAIWKSIYDKLIVVLLMLPAMQQFLRTLTTFARSPVLLIQDVIFFEDALGRTMKLDYAYFQDWSTLNAMLRFRFKGRPGEDMVSSGHFELLELAYPRTRRMRTLTQDTWNHRVRPGSKVIMAMLFRDSLYSGSMCPQCGSESLYMGRGEFMCASCDNNIRHLSRKALAIQDGETQYSEHSFSECELVNAFVGTTTTGFAISLPQAFKHFRTYGQKIHTYPKILREYLNRVTLEQFGVPWEADPQDKKYIVVTQKMTEAETDAMFAHTKHVRLKRLVGARNKGQKILRR